MIWARALAGFWTTPPNPPEWRSTAVPTTSIWAYMMPRRPTVMAGTFPVKKPVSLMIATSAATRSRFASSHASRCVELDSSSPSNTYLRLTGKRPRVARTAAADITMGVDLALVVGRAPRASIRPSTTTGSNGRRRPQVERIDGLDVVVAVDEDRRSAGSVEPVGVDDRMTARLVRLGRARVPPPRARRRASRRHADSRQRGPGAPRCSGCAGTPGRTRDGRRQFARGMRPGRRRSRSWSSEVFERRGSAS